MLGQTTGTLAANASAAQVQAVINAALGNIANTSGNIVSAYSGYAGGCVSVTTVGNGYTYQVTFLGNLAGQNLAGQMSVNGATVSEAVTGRIGNANPDVQLVQLPSGISNGTPWTIILNPTAANSSSATVTYTAAGGAAALQSALDGLAGISNGGTGYVTVSTVGNAWTYAVSFQGSLAGGPQPLLGSVGGSGIAISELLQGRSGTGLSEVQTVTLAGTPTAGSFTLTVNTPISGGNASYTTGTLAYNATALQVQTALDGLANVQGSGGWVTVLGNNNPGTSAGGPYTVIFGGALAGFQVPLLTTSSSFTPGSAAATVAETYVGGMDPINTTSANSLVMGIGGSTAASLNTGADGKLNLSTSPLILAKGANSTSAPAATIGGNLALPSAVTSLAFNVPDSYAAVGLNVSAAISAGSAVAVTKTLPGTLELSGVNTFTGGTTVSEGMVLAAANQAFGSAANTLTLASGTALGFSGGISYAPTEAVSVQSLGFVDPISGASSAPIYNLQGNNSFAGPLTFALGGTSSPAINSIDATGALTLTGAISAAGGFTVSGPGNTNLSGNITAGTSFTQATAGRLAKARCRAIRTGSRPTRRARWCSRARRL